VFIGTSSYSASVATLFLEKLLLVLVIAKKPFFIPSGELGGVYDFKAMPKSKFAIEVLLVFGIVLPYIFYISFS
jgi:hypothetical protein